MSDFFDNSILTCKKILSSKILCRVEVLIKLLNGIHGEFKVVAYYDYTMKWGRFCVVLLNSLMEKRFLRIIFKN